MVVDILLAEWLTALVRPGLSERHLFLAEKMVALTLSSGAKLLQTPGRQLYPNPEHMC